MGTVFNGENTLTEQLVDSLCIPDQPGKTQTRRLCLRSLFIILAFLVFASLLKCHIPPLAVLRLQALCLGVAASLRIVYKPEHERMADFTSQQLAPRFLASLYSQVELRIHLTDQILILDSAQRVYNVLHRTIHP